MFSRARSSPTSALLTPRRLYRAKTISEIGRSLKDEIAWLNPTALKHLKNYQIWHHRHTIIDELGSCEGEPEFINSMLELDSKNYHVWSYRQWLVKRFDLFDKPEELEWTHSMIEEDVRNNSAWNHRYYLVVGGREGKPSADLVEREIEYVSVVPMSCSTILSLPGTPKQPSGKLLRTRAHGTTSWASFAQRNFPSRLSRTLRVNSLMCGSQTMSTRATPSIS